MTFKTILVHAKDTDAGRHLLEAASAFANERDAHLVALVCGIEPMTPYVDMMAAPIDAYIEELRQAQADTRAEAKRVDTLLTRLGGSFEVRGNTVQSGLCGAEFARHARYADIAIFPRPEGSATVQRMLDTTIFDAGKPVILCPDGCSLAGIGRRVAIAWDASKEAARAVGDALPLMRDAQDVRVVVVDPHIAPVKHGEEPGADIAAVLARHALPVAVDALPDADHRFAEVFLKHARDIDADFLVAGAYGHARVVQVVLGGATRDLMRDAPLPLLLSH